jgi:lipopolysaccharide transport system ATP-binding protein
VSDVVISVEGLGKRYCIGGPRAPYRTIREAVNDAAMRPFSAARGLVRGRGPTGGGHRPPEIWALKDVSFEVRRGEVLGVIGRNGAGKSTLLKILSRITEPTTGRARLSGRVASLLEVGTGFHNELTGRENIYLNGAILGMTRDEISLAFDDIVEFAEIERFIETPVKHYSSGMLLRLAFSVAAHLQPEILLVDEVLAVGDAAFQRKCLGKMGSVATHGRTVIMVSHNLGAIKQLCRRVMWIDAGQLLAQGLAESTIATYLGSVGRSAATVDLGRYRNPYGRGELAVLSLSLLNAKFGSFAVSWDDPIRVSVRIRANEACRRVGVGVACSTPDGLPLFTVRSTDQDESGITLLPAEESEVRCTIHHNLRAGRYVVLIGVYSGNYNYYYNPSAAELDVSEVGSSDYASQNIGLITCAASWSV